MPNNNFGFDFEYQVYEDLLNDVTTPVTQLIKEMYGEKEIVEYTGEKYKSNGDIKYNKKIIEIKDVKSGNGTYANLGLNKAMKFLDLPTLNFNEYKEFLANKGYVSEYNGKANILSKEEAKEICEKEWYDEFKQLDNSNRTRYIKEITNIFQKNLEKRKQFVEYVIGKKEIGKKIVDSYIVYNSVKNTVNSFTKEELCSKQNTDALTATKKGIDFGTFRVQFSWKNHIGFNLAIYVFI